MPRDLKFPGEEVERLKSDLRIEETFPDADACPACLAARRETGDATFLCNAHLERIYGADHRD